MKHMIFVAGLAFALAMPVHAEDKKESNPPVKVDLKKAKIEKPDPAKAKEAEKAQKAKPANKDAKKAPVKKAEAVKCDLKKDPKCKDVIRKPKTKEEREAEKAAKK